MPVLRIAALVFVIGYAPISHAGWKDSLRPYVEKFLGSDIANKLFGVEEVDNELPPIPEISKDAKSLDVYQRPEDPNKDAGKGKDLDKFNYRFINEVYKATRDVKPTAEQLNNWMNVLSQGGTREGLYRALVLDNSYAAKEGMEFPLNDSSVNFAMEFFSRYLNRSLTKAQLEKSNFYTLKRVTTERVLEILDAYILKNREHLYDWYAIFSGEMAKSYPQAFKSKLRKNPSVEIHRRWATKVPEQFLIGEVIVKIHLLYNQFR